MIKVEFVYEQKKNIIECDLNTKLLSIFETYSKEEDLDINHLIFLYSGDNLNANKYLNKSLNEIINQNNKDENKIIISVDYSEFDRSDSLVLLNPGVAFEQEHIKKKYFNFFIRLYFLLFIKFLLISLALGICFFFEFNYTFINNKYYILGIFISSFLTISIISILLFFITEESRYSKTNYIFHFFYLLCIFFTCLVLSKYISFKIIMSCIIIIDVNILAIGIIIVIFKKYNFYGFLFIPFIINIISLILIYYLWIQNLIQIIYISGFALFITISHFITTYSLFQNFRIKNINEFIFLSIIISLSIFSIIGLLIKALYNYINSNVLVDNIRTNFFKIYLILILEFVFVLLAVFLGFYFKFNSLLYNSRNICILFALVIILFTLLFLILLLVYQEDEDKSFLFIINFFIFIPCIIISFFLLSKYINQTIILSFLILILSNAISIEISIILTQKWKIFGIFLISFVFNLICTLFIYLFWDRNLKEIIYLLVFVILLFSLNSICHFALLKYFDNNNKFFILMVMHQSILVSICLLFYKFFKYSISLFLNDEDEIDNDNEKKVKIFLRRTNFLLLLEYLFTLLIVIISRNSSVGLYNSFKNNIFGYLIFFGVPISISFLPFIAKKSEDNKGKEICVFILCNIIHFPVMVIFYILLYNYINTVYLLTSFIAIILSFELYVLLDKQFKRSSFNIMPFLAFSSLLAFYLILKKADIVIILIISFFFYIYIMVIENICSGCCKENIRNNEEMIISCDCCYEDACICNDGYGCHFRYFNTLYCYSFINLFKMIPFSLFCFIPFAFLYSCCIICYRGIINNS